MGGSPDVVVVGAGVFGAWTAYQLRRSGRSITLVDAYAPGNFRASSGGESRVMRIGYGGNESYSRWALRSLYQWQELFRETRRPLFIKSGVLWLGRQNDPLTDATTLTLQKLGMRVELLSRDDLATRFSQFHLGSITRGVFEPESGVILARHAVQTLVTEAARCGVECASAAVTPPNSSGSRLTALSTGSGTQLTAETFVFACGAWLPKLFPKLLTPYIHTTRQEVFFFGPGPGDCQFAPPAMPAWIDFHDGIYGLPDLNGRGFKIGLDRHGPLTDPDTGERLPSPETLVSTRQLATKRLPALKNAQLLDARVCQYSNTWNGDFLIDRHPNYRNVWLVGGGSGHGFKHGPAVGEYVTGLLTGTGEPESRFTLANKHMQWKREVF